MTIESIVPAEQGIEPEMVNMGLLARVIPYTINATSAMLCRDLLLQRQ